jgi:hypothetical protein
MDRQPSGLAQILIPMMNGVQSSFWSPEALIGSTRTTNQNQRFDRRRYNDQLKQLY